ncbi:MAG TPA: lysylphosphatidylglycerol synthase transmembrane domain-containing protein [Gemmatimonadales bacterium]|nr:lysylphosphatidylglycerol synthase transmembrane domain-containing protein [Gemmatimonadales bacterium]
MRQRWFLLLSAFVLGGVAYLGVTHPEQVHGFAKTLSHLSPLSVGIAFVLILGQVSAQALRMWAIIPRDTPLGVLRAGYVFTVGDLTNILVPARGGDALKVLLMNRAVGGPRIALTRATGAMFADKVVDIGTLIMLCALTGMLSLVVIKTQATLPPLWVVMGIAGGLILLLAGFWYAPPRWLAARMGGLHELARGLSGLKDPLRCSASVAFSVVARLAEVLALRVLCSAMAFPLSLSQVLVALVIVNLSVSVPVSVANLGVYEAGLAFGLTRAGVPLPVAITLATTHHALELLGITLSAAGYTLAIRIRPQETAPAVHSKVVPRSPQSGSLGGSAQSPGAISD